jgi:hypothetical protein
MLTRNCGDTFEFFPRSIDVHNFAHLYIPNCKIPHKIVQIRRKYMHKTGCLHKPKRTRLGGELVFISLGCVLRVIF